MGARRTLLLLAVGAMAACGSPATDQAAPAPPTVGPLPLDPTSTTGLAAQPSAATSTTTAAVRSTAGPPVANVEASATEAPSSIAPSTAAPSTVTPSTVAPATVATTPPPPSPISLAFGGDVHGAGIVGQRLARDGDGLLTSVAPVLQSADVAVVNLETAITDGGTAADKEFAFRAPPALLDALAAAGIDAASMANNHGLDYGTEGLADSLAAAADRGFPLLGIGVDEATAYRPWVVDVRGQRIAVVAATQVLDGNLTRAWTATATKPGMASAKRVERLVQAVQEAAAQADLVVVFLHWGIEKDTCPSADQRSLALTLAEAGADAVVGSHAHRLQGAGFLGSTLVAYGLGNFAFYSASGDATRSGVLRLTAAGGRVLGYDWVPARITDGTPVPLTGEEAATAQADFLALQACTGLSPTSA